MFEYQPVRTCWSSATTSAVPAPPSATPPSAPGAWVDLRTEFGARSVVRSVNGAQVFADGRGVGRDWQAYLIVNLSVSADRYHPAPAAGTAEMPFEVSGLVVRAQEPRASRTLG